MLFSSEVLCLRGRRFYRRARSGVNTFLGEMQIYFQLVLHFRCFAPLANFDHPSGINPTKPWPTNARSHLINVVATGQWPVFRRRGAPVGGYKGCVSMRWFLRVAQGTEGKASTKLQPAGSVGPEAPPWNAALLRYHMAVLCVAGS
jgi:hypothetical protein